MSERFALYYAPAVSDPLWQLAARWLDRDPAGPRPMAATTGEIPADERRRFTGSARRYGFHATIKAPMQLPPGLKRADLEHELARFAARTAPATIGPIVVSEVEGFIALVAERQSPALAALAFDVVDHFDRFRAPLTAAERQKRIHEGRLNPERTRLLERYGYPYVGAEFRFHMTLSDRLGEGDRARVLEAAESWFEPALRQGYDLDRLALFHEPEPGAPFLRVADYPLAAKVTADA